MLFENYRIWWYRRVRWMLVNWTCVCFAVPSNPVTLKSDPCQIPPAASPEILHHTVMENLVFHSLLRRKIIILSITIQHITWNLCQNPRWIDLPAVRQRQKFIENKDSALPAMKEWNERTFSPRHARTWNENTVAREFCCWRWRQATFEK